MSDQTSRKWLVETLQALPEKTRNKGLVAGLSRFCEMTEKARDTFRASLTTAQLVESVFPKATFVSLYDRIGKAANLARTCQRDLAKSLDAVSKKPFEERVMVIKEHSTAAGKAVPEAWERNLLQEIGVYEQLGHVVAERGLRGGVELQQELTELRERSSKPPQNHNDAQTLSTKLHDFPNLIKKLGLTGKAGKFLVAVADGRGSPRDLEDDEVRELLDRYNLWDSLRVVLGPRR